MWYENKNITKKRKGTYGDLATSCPEKYQCSRTQVAVVKVIIC